eukprot:35334-Pelagomonas_calceolata.AAC.2
MASPMDHNPHYQHYWSYDPRDTLFGAYHYSFSSKLSGFSVCHPIYNEKRGMTVRHLHAVSPGNAL